MPDFHPLDNPIWSALVTGWASLARGSGTALRLDPEYGPFAGVPDRSHDSLSALDRLLSKDDELWIAEAEPFLPPWGTVTARSGLLAQLVAGELPPAVIEPAILDLTEDDAAEMYALAHLTKPGPFHPKTHRLGAFVGIRDKGRLIAMAGERMRLDGFTELSGVCTHPDFRGRGLAAKLMLTVAQRMVAGGSTPFLHSYADNHAALALYNKLGFYSRANLVLTVLTRG